jgi:hypothetical protein
LAYFRHLAALAPANIWAKNKVGTVPDTDRTSALQQLRTMVDSGFVPKPLDFTVVRDDGEENDEVVHCNNDDDEDDDEEVDEEADATTNGAEDQTLDDDEEDDDDDDEERMLVRLSLGEPGSEDFFTYDLWQPVGASLKKSRQKLSAMALEDLMGLDSDDVDDDDEDLIPGLSNTGYEWEIHHAVPGKTDAYLYGLLWNLQTYQDGVCADYAYNYGKRLSPTAGQIVEFLEAAQEEKRIVGLRELAERPFSPPINAGLSCLAALPSKVKDLVPAPYCNLPTDIVEGIYGSCMDPNDNVFDMKKFERLCEEQVDLLKILEMNEDGDKRDATHDERRIMMGDHYWTVISKVKAPLAHPFDPPAPFTERLSKLRPNNRIRVSRFMAMKEPRQRTVWTENAESATSKSPETKKKKGFVSKEPRDLSRHSDPGAFIASHDSIDKVPYKTAYSKPQERKEPKKGKLKITLSKLSEISIVEPVKEPKQALPTKKENQKMKSEKKEEKNKAAKVSVAARMKEFNVERPPKVPDRTIDGHSPMACLKQLEDIGIVGALTWDETMPSTSAYAAFDPKGHENVRLCVGKGTDLNAALFKDLIYEQDRDVNLVPRQAIKHHLAALALCDITGTRIKWSELAFKDITELLSQKSGESTIKKEAQ